MKFVDETLKKRNTTSDEYLNFVQDKIQSTKSSPKKLNGYFMKDDSSRKYSLPIKLDIILNNK